VAEPTEIEKLVGELEIAVDRVRSLYEQYFMGIEKLEPTVPRKDVDRRIHSLRKEQIRNTAQRFRFQMILQRYNTYQTHWQRICREIESGTYKRHLARAKRRFGSVNPPAGATQAGQVAKEQGANEKSIGPAPGAAIAAELAAELAELDREFASAEFEIDVVVEEPEPSSRRMPPPGAAPRSPAPAARAGGTPPPPPRAKSARPSDPPPGAAALAPPLPPPRALGSPATSPAPAGKPLPPPRPRLASTMPTAQTKAPLPSPSPSPHTPAHHPPAAKPQEPSRQELPEARLKQLYAQYVDAKRRQNESTAAVTYQSVAKTLQESGEKLRQKHGRSVDFEVTVKDGKAILRPVLK